MLGLSVSEFWHEITPWEFALRLQGLNLANGLTVAGEMPDNDPATAEDSRRAFQQEMQQYGADCYAAQKRKTGHG